MAIACACAWACDRGQAAGPPRYQGVAELEERHLAFELGGRLAALAVSEAATVEAGALVARLDDVLERRAREPLVARLAQARAGLELLEAGARREDVRRLEAQLRGVRSAEALVGRSLDRQRRLEAGGVASAAAVDELEARRAQVSAEREALEAQLRLVRSGARPEEREAARARVAEAEAAVTAADERLARYTLLAPVGGTVLEVMPAVGEVVGPGTPVATLAEAGGPYVDVFVPQQHVGDVHVGMPARVEADALRDALPGRVERIARRTEFTPRYLFSDEERMNLVLRVRVRVTDPEARLHAGVPCFVTFETSGPRP